MRFVVRLAPLLGLCAGCGFAQKPYADDPLLRGGRAVWTTRESAHPVTPPAVPTPIEPPAPPVVPTPVPTSPRWE